MVANMRVIGIDPGLQCTGYGIVEGEPGELNPRLVEAGVIRTKEKDKIQKRLKDIHSGFLEVIREFKPELCVLEKLYAHYRHPTTALLMGHARGVICLACGEKKIKLVSFAATRIKKAVSGQGNASKMQIQRLIQHIFDLPEPPRSYDVTDALALAVAYLYIAQDKT